MTAAQINAFLNAGLSFIPVGNDKRPWLNSWTEYQFRRPEPDEIQDMNFRDAPGVAIICGDVSGGIEVIDFDTKNDPMGTIWKEFGALAKAMDLDNVLKNVVIQSTMSGGYHILYKCPKPGRSEKLALHDSGKPIIETRGNGGYVVVYPTERYQLLRGDITKINPITQQDRDRLLEVCRQLNRKSNGFTVQAQPMDRETMQIKKTLDKICSQIEQAKVDITANYDDWVKIGHGLAYSLGEEGRTYYHKVSSFHPDYTFEGTNTKYNDLVKGRHKNKYATIKSLFMVAKNYGIDIRSEDDGAIDPIEDWIQKEDFSYNEVTMKIEDRYGKPIDDNWINTYYRRSRKALGKKFSMAEFTSCLFNYDNLRTYNPILDFFEALRVREYKGTPVDDYIAHLDIKDDRWKPIIRKWMLSVVAQAYGYTSEIVLVLVGPQYIGKTQFFLRMFPPDFAEQYCIIDSLKEGKDSRIKMTQKLVIVDDEFGGLNRQDTEHFKSIVSQKIFTIRLPYGRTMMDLPRLCVFAGASNKMQVINDFTGNRRILPVEVINRDLEKADKVNRLDMWAELVQEYWSMDSQDRWMVSLEEIEFIKDASEEYQQENSARDYITRMYKPAENGVFMTATEICDLINEKYPNAKLYPNRIGQELSHLGFERVQQKRGKQFRIYGYKVLDANDHSDLENKADLPF